jgi:hypothetical protein
VQLTGEAEAARRQAIGLAEAKATEALGLARATGFEAQKDALGGPATAVVAVANAVADGHITVVPEVLVTGGGGSLDGLAATLMRSFGTGANNGSSGGGGSERGDGASARVPAPPTAVAAGPPIDTDVAPETVEVPTDVEAAALAEEESRPDDGPITP